MKCVLNVLNNTFIVLKNTFIVLNEINQKNK